MTVTISCIIPCYNVDRTLLLPCVESVLRQDFPDFEILIVDNGSDNAHVACLTEITHLDPRIHVIRQENRGVSAARNTGLLHAQGEYVAFLDADDVVVPTYFSEAYHIASQHQADYVAGGILLTPSPDSSIPQETSPQIDVRSPDQYCASVIMITDQLPGGGHIGRGATARLVRRSILDQVRFPEDMAIFEDIVWNLTVVPKCQAIYVVHQIWYLYRTNPSSATQRYNDQIIGLCEAHLRQVAQMIHLNHGEEVTAYGAYVFELLSSYVYRNYLGHAQCPLSRRERRQLFHALCRREPWTLYQTDLFKQSCDRRTRMKHFLIRSGLLYRFCAIRKRLEKN